MDEKQREKARNAIKDILEAAGFSVSLLEDPFDLAVRNDEYLMVLCSNDAEEIDDFNQSTYTLTREGREISYRKLLFTLNEAVNAANCIVWGGGEFVRFSGEAALSRLLDRTFSLSFSGPAGAAGIALETAVEGAGATPSEGMAGEDLSGVTIPHMPLRVNKEAAEKIAGVQGNINLRFMPYWFYSYKSTGEQIYKEHRIPFDSEGAGAINAINGLHYEKGEEAVTEGPVPQSAEIVKPRITKDDATEKIYNEVIEKLTQRVRIKQVNGDAIFYEEKVIKPERKNISIDLRQIYVPVWQVRGKKIVEVNASTGEILSEPMDEGVEIL